MGCDIHAYIESYSHSEHLTRPGKYSARCLAENIGFGRDYALFGLLANVRTFPSRPQSNPKGIPTSPELSYECAGRYYMSVCDSDICPNTNCHAYTTSITRELAEQYIDSGTSKYTDSTKTSIKDPYLHSATHLTLDEMMNIRKEYLIDTITQESEISSAIRKKNKKLLAFIDTKDPSALMRYSFPDSESSALYATIKMMQAAEQCSSGGDIKTRFVCWFDS